MRSVEHIWAVCIWYRPDGEVVNNMQTYQGQIEGVIVVDNSDDDHSHLLIGTHVIYVANHTNRGIATALNQGIEEAIRRGAEWVLTMDQDSRFVLGDAERYIQAIQDCTIKNVGMWAPYQLAERPEHYADYEEVRTVMTSGCLLSKVVYEELGGMREDFFIDQVDEEYCCRLRRAGYKVMQLPDIWLQHHLGNGLIENKFWHKRYQDHAPWRYYYMARNRWRIIKEYPEYAEYYRKQQRKMIKRVLLYDTHCKWTKLRYILRAWHEEKLNKKN